MFKKTAWAISLMAIQLGSAAWAQDGGQAETLGAREGIDGRYYVAPALTFTFMDKDRHTDDGIGGTLAIGKEVTERFMLELSGGYTTADGDDGSVNFQNYGVNALVFPKILEGAYGLAGVGYGKRDAHYAGENNARREGTRFNFGLGYLAGPFAVLNDGSLRFEVREQIEQPNADRAENFYDTVLSVGLVYPLGKSTRLPPEPAQPVEVVATVSDSDQDGVADDADQCPNTPAGTKVDANGCPLPQPCEVGADGTMPDLAACKVGDKIVLKNVHFEFDRATLTPDAKAVLDGVYDALGRAADVHVEVGGHTDAKGSDEYNQKLSERRAVSVRKYLVKKGVDAGRLNAAGYGESQPVGDNESDEGRELNRRVEMKIIDPATPLSVPKVSEAPRAAPVESSAPAMAAPSEPAPAYEPAAAPAAETVPAPAAEPSEAPAGDPFGGR